MKLLPKRIADNLTLNVVIALIGLIFVTGVGYYVSKLLFKSYTKQLLISYLDSVYEMVDIIYKKQEIVIYDEIEKYFKQIAADNLKKIDEIYSQYKDGKKSLDEVKKEIVDFILSQKYGKSGYPAIANNNNVLLYHPVKKYIGFDLKKKEWGEKIYEWAKGLEESSIGTLYKYYWRNPKDRYAKLKVLLPYYYAPLKWIFYITAYRSEVGFFLKGKITEIIDIRSFLRRLKAGKRGYFYVINGNLVVVVHPKAEGKHLNNLGKIGAFLKKIISSGKKQDFIEYKWQGKEKFAEYKYYRPADWYIFVSGYYEDVMQEQMLAKLPLLIGGIISLLLATFLIFQRRRILGPTRELVRIMRKAEKGDISELYSFRKLSCSNILKCEEKSCEFYGKENNRCFLINGSFAKEYGGVPKEFRKFARCEDCPVFKKAIQNEFDEIGLWVSLLILKLAKITEVFSSIEGVSLRASEKLTENSRHLIEIAGYMDKEFGNIESALKSIKNVVNEVLEYSSAEQKRIESIISQIDEISNSIRESGEMSNKFTNEFEKLKNRFMEEVKILAKTIEYIASLEKDYEKIRDIVKFIKDIASETSLLSLNASIEAARAGEKGKGFAVVADEISKLSVQTQESSQEISELVEASIDRGLKGIKYVEALERKLKDIIGETSNIVETATPIFQANVSNAEKVETMKTIMLDMGEIFKKIAENVENQDKKADVLISLVGEFRKHIDTLRKISEILGDTSEVVQGTTKDFGKILEFFKLRKTEEK